MRETIIYRALLWLVAATAALADPAHGAPAKPWSAFDLAPLTILSPGDKAISNPPFFHWQPVAGARGYEVVVRSAGGVTTYSTGRNFITPPRPMPSGDYEYEVRARLDDGSTTSAARGRLQIVENTPGVATDLDALTSRTGERILFVRDVMDRVARSTDPVLSGYRDKMLAHAREPRPAIMEPLREPERYPQGEWEIGLWRKGNTLTGAIEDYVLVRIGAYVLTKDRQYLSGVEPVLAEIVSWNAVGSTGVWENDHSAWSMLHVLSVAYDVLREELPAALRVRMRDAIAARCRDLYGLLNPFLPKELSSGMMNDPDNNHPWFCAAAMGMGGLALLGETPEAEQWVAFAAQLFHGVFLPRGGAQGGWHEGIDYWSYALYFVVQFVDALQAGTGADLSSHPWLSHTAFFKVYVHPPKGGYVPFGDCKHSSPTDFDKLVMMWFASRYSDPLAARYVDAITTGITDTRLIHALRWFPEKVRRAPQAELPKAVHFADIGWVVANSDVFDAEKQILFAMRAGPTFGRGFGHSHADQNHFVVTAGGDKLIWDAGYYDSYLSPHHRSYSSTAQAHNTIFVDGEGQLVHRPGLDGKTVDFRVDGESLHVTGDASNPLLYGGRVKKHLRTIDVQKHTSFTVTDQVELRDAGRITWLLHSALPWKLDASGRKFEVAGARYQLSGEFDSDEPVTATLRDRFPVPENQKAEEAAAFARKYPNQYTIEWSTKEKLTRWSPRLRFNIRALDASIAGTPGRAMP